MAKKRVHLVCNAHLDPVWLWHWEDGLTEALSTFVALGGVVGVGGLSGAGSGGGVEGYSLW